MVFFRIYREDFGPSAQQYPPGPNFPSGVTFGLGGSGQAGVQGFDSLGSDGMRIEVVKPVAEQNIAAFGIFVTPIRFTSKRFRLNAKFHSLAGPNAPVDIGSANPMNTVESVWAALVQFRTGGLPDLQGENRFTASVQHNLAVDNWDPAPARLNAAPNATDLWLDQQDYDEIFRRDGRFSPRRQGNFQLQIDFDMEKGQYTGTLRMGWLVKKQTPTFALPATVTDSNGTVRPMGPELFTAAGVAIAIARPRGVQDSSVVRASVVVSQLTIFEDVSIPKWIYRWWKERAPWRTGPWGSRAG